MEGLKVSSNISIFSVFLYFFARECFYAIKNTPKKVKKKTSRNNLDERVLSQYNPRGNGSLSLNNILLTKIFNLNDKSDSLVLSITKRHRTFCSNNHY